MDRLTILLFSACRKGDVECVQQLVEQNDVELNIRDKWDSTPLYYACLCGHEELVKYLLENDAKCEANTFDGERCLYGALTDKIRSLLVNYKAITTSTIRRDVYTEFLRKLLERPDQLDDIEFIVHGERFTAHKCILAARSEYLADKIRTSRRDKPSITINNAKVTCTAFRLMLQYLYTARVEVALEHVNDLINLARSCRLDSLQVSLDKRRKRVESFECTKPGVSVTVISLEPSASDCSLQRDMSALAEEALPMEFFDQAGVELPFPPKCTDWFPDIIFSVEGHHFRCHKVFFAGRSDYFKILMKDTLGESQNEEEDGLSVVTLHDISALVFMQIMYYIYQDSCELTEQNVFEILYKADFYLLPGLKSQCAAKLARCINLRSVVSILRLARLFSLVKLENQCAEHISVHLDEMLSSEEFAAFVTEDAQAVQHRQETDSIPIIDDLRFHVTSQVQTFSDMCEADQRLAAIDAFLEQLQLDG